MGGVESMEFLARDLAHRECEKIVDEALLERLAASKDPWLVEAAKQRLAALVPTSVDGWLARYRGRLATEDREGALAVLEVAERAFPSERRIMRARLHMMCGLPTTELLAFARSCLERFPGDPMLVRFVASLEHEEKIVTLVPELRRKALDPALSSADPCAAGSRS